MVANRIVLTNLPVATETDAVAFVVIDTVATELYPAVLLHSNATQAVVKYTVGDQPGQLTAL